MKAERTSEETFQDGTAVIVELTGEFYLTVTPPRGVGRPVDIEDVRQKIRKKKIPNVNEETVKEVVDACPGESVRITGDPDALDSDRLKVRDRDGFASLISKEDLLYLSVCPPKGKGKRLGYEEVETYFRKNCIIDVDYAQVRKVVEAAEGKAVKITRKSKKAREEIPEDAVEISVSEDNMEARIILHSTTKNGVALDLPIILNMLREVGVVYGIDEKKIEGLLQGKGIGEQIVVARGDPAEGIVYELEIPSKGKPRIVQEGKADYYRQDQLPLVKKGQVLAIKTLSQGEPRRNVKGEKTIPKAIYDLRSIMGKNTLISPNRRELRAAISGYVYSSGGRVHVEHESMVIKGDVNPSMGDIYFEGDIHIGGSVLPGSKVEAVGNIEVWGGAKEAEITSIDGSVKARSSQSSAISAKRDILIEEGVTDSTLTASRLVSVEGESGIAGGRVTAGVGIKAVNVGSKYARLTELSIINPAVVEIARELADLEERIRDLNEKLITLGKELNTGKEKDLLLREMDSYLSLKKEIAVSTSRKERLENTAMPKPEGWKIEVTDTLYPGTLIYIGDTTIARRIKLNKVVFYDNNGRVEEIVG